MTLSTRRRGKTKPIEITKQDAFGSEAAAIARIEMPMH